MIDDELKGKIQSRLLPDDKSKDRLFDDGEAPLQSFNSKILLARRLGDHRWRTRKTSSPVSEGDQERIRPLLNRHRRNSRTE